MGKTTPTSKTETEDEDEDENKDEIENVINSSPSPSASHQSQGEQAKTDEPGDELHHRFEKIEIFNSGFKFTDIVPVFCHPSLF